MEYPTPVTPEFPYFTSNHSNRIRSRQSEYPCIPCEPQGGSYHNAPSIYLDPRLAQHSPSFSVQWERQEPPYQPTNYQLPRSPNIPYSDPRPAQHSPPFGPQQVPYEAPYQPRNYQLPRSPKIPIDPALYDTSAPTAPMAPMVPASSSPIPPQRGPIEVAGAQFQYYHQRFIIYAIGFLGYSANDVAPVFGVENPETGNLRISAAQVDAAHEYLKNGREYNGENGLWERNDNLYKAQIRVKIGMAHERMYRLRMKQIEDEEAERCRRVRENIELMDGAWKEEQKFFKGLMLKDL